MPVHALLRRSRRSLTLGLALPVVLASMLLAGPSVAAAGRPACDAPAAGRFACRSSWQPSLPVSPARIAAAGSASAAAAGAKVPAPKDGLTPANIRAAYRLPIKGGKGITIGIVDAYDDPKAESDLKVYRSAFKLPACTTANKCFRKVDQRGGRKYPEPDAGWSTEISLDVQAVSAACPQCRILLVEADSPTGTNLGRAVRTAVRLGADVVSNSYGIDESPREIKNFTAYYRQPGVPVLASAGDAGLTVGSFPAVLGNVWAVGGTVLSHSAAKGWKEQAWRHGGSGCSAFIAKPAYQKDGLCAGRTVADVAVLADDFAVYDTYGLGEDNGWVVMAGTSLSSPLLAAMMGLAGHPAKAASPKYAYTHLQGYRDITKGNNADCDNALCNAGPGYDAPTGIGAPRGLTGL